MSSTRIWPGFFLILFPFSIPAQSPSLVLPVAGDGYLSAVRFDAGRKYFTTISSGAPNVKGWDARTQRLLFNLDGLQSASFSADGNYILALDDENNCILYHSFSGKKHTEIRGDQWVFRSARLSPNRKYILTIGVNESAHALIWETGTGKLLYDINLGKYNDMGLSGIIEYYHGQFSPDEKTIATSALFDRPARIWDLASGKLLKTFPDTTVLKTGLAFTPDGKRLLSWSTTGITIWNCGTGRQQAFIPEKSKIEPYHLFSPNSKYLITGTRTPDDTARVWEIETGRPSFRFLRNGFGFSQPQFSNDSRYIATLTPDQKELKLIACPSGNLAKVIHDTIHTKDGRIVSLAVRNYEFTPDNKSILTVGFSDCLRTWDINTGNLVRELDTLRGSERDEIGIVSFVQFSRDGNFIEKIYTGGKIRVYDYKKGARVQTFSLPQKAPRISEYRFSPNGTQWLMVLEKKVIVWDRLKGTIQFTLDNEPGNDLGFSSTGFSPDGSLILTTSFDGSARCWQASDGKLLLLLPHPRGVTSGAFDPTGRFVVTGCGDSTVRIWDIGSKKFVRALPKLAGIVFNAFYSPDGRHIYTESNPPDNILDLGFSKEVLKIHRQVGLWRSDTNLLVASIDSVTTISSQFSPDSRYVLFNYIGARAWDWATGEVKAISGTAANRLIRACFTPDQKEYVKVCSDSTYFFNYPSIQLSRVVPFKHGGHEMKFDYSGTEMMIFDGQRADFYNTASLTTKYSLVFLDSNHHLVLLPEGYYQCRPGTASLLYYVTGNRQFISFEQLDARYNRPDKVLEAIGNADTALIRSYRRAWEKRIRKLGIDTMSFREGYAVPEADFANRDAISTEQRTKTLNLRIKGIDSVNKLDRFNVWVNGSPIFGQRGISIRRKNSNTVDTAITIRLSQGENRIETGVTSVNGTESYRIPLYVTYTPANRQKEILHFVGVGIDRFSDSRHNLQYSSKDIRDLALKLRKKYRDNIIIDTLFNEQVTVENIKALKKRLKQTTENDKVIVFYSGHGLLNKDYDYYLSTYAIDFDKPELKGLPYDEFENLVDSIPARRKLMLIDACHSGEVDKEDLVRLEAVNQDGVKGLRPVAYRKEGQLGLHNSFELMQALFVNVSKGTGATVISAAAGTQFALERGDLKNGVFTYSILETLDKHPRITVSELRRIVGVRVEQLTGGVQKPTSRSEPVDADWEL